MVCKDGKAAVNFEHAWGDGVPVLRFFNEVKSNLKISVTVKPVHFKRTTVLRVLIRQKVPHYFSHIFYKQTCTM